MYTIESLLVKQKEKKGVSMRVFQLLLLLFLPLQCLVVAKTLYSSGRHWSAMVIQSFTVKRPVKSSPDVLVPYHLE